jgi:hypothetical protein
MQECSADSLSSQTVMAGTAFGPTGHDDVVRRDVLSIFRRLEPEHSPSWQGLSAAKLPAIHDRDAIIRGTLAHRSGNGWPVRPSARPAMTTL